MEQNTIPWHDEEYIRINGALISYEYDHRAIKDGKAFHDTILVHIPGARMRRKDLWNFSRLLEIYPGAQKPKRWRLPESFYGA